MIKQQAMQAIANQLSYLYNSNSEAINHEVAIMPQQ
jgi:hypothetical protein